MKPFKHLLIIVLCLLCFQCSIDRTITITTAKENTIHHQFQQLDYIHKLYITDQNEPGERLSLCVTFINKHNSKVLSAQRVKFYHTANNGAYEPSDKDDESSARLSGIATTNRDGKIYIETILPGDYGSSEDNRHIHMSVFDAMPEAYDINFNQYTGKMSRNFINGSDQHFLADLKRAKDSTLVCFITIEVKKPKILESPNE